MGEGLLYNIGVPWKKTRPAASHWQTYHIEITLVTVLLPINNSQVTVDEK